MQLNNLLRFDYWLDASVMNQPAGRAMWLVVIAGVTVVLITGVLVARGRLARGAGAAWLGAGVLLGAVGLGRIFAVPVLGLRLGWLIAGVLAIAPVAARVFGQAGQDGFADDCVRALAFAPLRARERDWHPSTTLAWLIVHLGGLAVVLTNIRLRAGWAPFLLALLLLPVLGSMAGRRAQRRPLDLWRLSALSPLVILYVIALIGAAGVRISGVLNGVLYLPLALIVLSAYAFAIGVRLSIQTPLTSGESLGQGVGDLSFIRLGAMVLIVASIAWSAWAAWSLRTHGVTGSDPYAYAQMGVDLATRGTVFHPFPLVRQTYDLQIPSYPITHIGYRIPTDASRESTTVWPPGYAVFTALAYLVAGESGLYFITPLINLIALGVVGWLALVAIGLPSPNSLGRRVPAGDVPPLPLGERAFAVAALAVMLTATSYQQVEWQMIPMADIAAQVFTLLALGLALTARGSYLKAICSGLALGIAFDIRYTQVLAALPIALALLLTADEQRTTQDGHPPSPVSRLGPVVACALAAFVAALPVLFYHQAAFGSPLLTGSEELGNFSLPQAPDTLLRTLGELNSYREFGLLTPFMLIGAIALWRSHRRAMIVLLSLVIVLGGFHVVYAYLRLRDILFLFPVFSLFAAIGAVDAFDKLSRPSSVVGRLAVTIILCAASFVFTLRALETLAMPATRGFGAFGYLVQEQRASFDRLREMTPEDAVIGCSLNSGAVDLHARRQTFRPATWTAEEVRVFADALMREGVPVFIMDDGDELRESIDALKAHYAVREIGRIDVPYYDAIGGGSQNRNVPVYEVLSRKS